MIPRSLPPLPPHILNDPLPKQGGTVDIDSAVVDTSVAPKETRRKRKKKSNNNSENSHIRHGNITEAKNSPNSADSEAPGESQRGYNQNNRELLTASDDSKKVAMFSVLDRLKLKGRNSRDATETFEAYDKHPVENNGSRNLKGDLPVTVSVCFGANLVSQPIAKMFVEEERGFRAISEVPGAASEFQDAVCNNQPASEVQSAVELAVKTEKFFHTFSTFCHGLLAGMALWQCIIVYQLGPPHFETADFFSHYSSLSQPMQTLFYFFFVVCVVSAFDRYDVGNPQCSKSKCTFPCRSGIIIVIIYPVSLILSLAIANIDDKMSLHNYNASLWTTEDAVDMDRDLFYWKILNLGRCIGAVVGWIIVALQPSVNSFLHHLEYVGCTVK